MTKKYQKHKQAKKRTHTHTKKKKVLRHPSHQPFGERDGCWLAIMAASLKRSYGLPPPPPLTPSPGVVKTPQVLTELVLVESELAALACFTVVAERAHVAAHIYPEKYQASRSKDTTKSKKLREQNSVWLHASPPL